MSKSFSLVVRNTPSQNLVSSNHVYVDEKVFDGKVTYVQMRDVVFLASPHAKAETGSICLNRIQRTSAHASVDRPATVDLFVPPKHNFSLSSVRFEVDFLNTNTVLQNEVDAKQLSDHIAGVYVNQIFKDGQKLVIAFEGNMLLGTVSQMEVFNTEAAEQGLKEIATMGMMMQSTKVILSKPKTSQIQFINMESTAMNNDLFKQVSFESLGIGGLDAEIGKIFRRAFASRIFPPDIVKKLGITHVKGLLLFGPPGCGKTLMARQIGKMLNCHEPKVINGPEILNKYVGQSEENIRKLFEDAEAEYAEKGDNSELHLVIFDEIDAICKQRGSTSGGTGVNDSVVNQLLSKIDGVNALNNILIIGMTNRLDMMDEALLRPGRFEVQMEIGLPDEKGRGQILKIHTENMRKHNMLANDVDVPKLSELTKNYSGAELAGLVRSATSFAMNRQVDYENIGKKTIDTKNLKVSWFDFEHALEEVKPAFGVSQNEFDTYLSQGLIDYGPSFVKLMSTCRSFINQVKTSTNTNVLSMLLEGAKGSGKTTLAAHLAVHSGYPYVKIISPDAMVGYGEQQKCSKITKIFMDAYKSPLSVIVLDELERLIEYVDIGPRFSNVVLQTILVLVKKQPPKGRKLFIVGTTSQFEVIRRLEIHDSFNIIQTIPRLKKAEEIEKVLLSTNSIEPNSENLKKISKEVALGGMSIKDLLLIVEAAKSKALVDEGETTKTSPYINYDEFVGAMADCGQGKEDLLTNY